MKTGAAVQPSPTPAWHDVCSLKSLTLGRGAVAQVAGELVALFRVDDQVFAVQQLDPISGANVMSRCIVGRTDDQPTVTSPMYGLAYDLRSGRCLHPAGGGGAPLRTYPVRVHDGIVTVGAPAAS